MRVPVCFKGPKQFRVGFARQHGTAPVAFEGASAWTLDSFGPSPSGLSVVVAPDSTGRIVLPLVPGTASVPWWLALGKRGDVFVMPFAGSGAA